MTAGGGGRRKNIWGAQINFTLIFGREDHKKNYGLHPSRLRSFGAQVSLGWGGGICLLPGRVLRDVMVQISLLAHKFRGDDKKSLRREILRLVLTFNRVFALELNFTHAWGAQAVF